MKRKIDFLTKKGTEHYCIIHQQKTKNINHRLEITFCYDWSKPFNLYIKKHDLKNLKRFIKKLKK